MGTASAVNQEGPEGLSHQTPVPCPSCQHLLPTFPKARRKCPSCRAWIHVRRQDNTDSTLLLTEDQARRFDEERRRRYEKEARRAADQRWAELNRRLVEAMKANDWGAMSSIYFEQALQLWREGKTFFHILQEAKRSGLRNYLRSELGMVQIITAHDESCCSACLTLDGKKLSVTEAIREMPIPVANCTTDVHEFGQQQGWCRCDYLPVIPE